MVKENGSGGVRQFITKALKSLDAVAIENYVGLGTPDINYTEGWIELKYIKNYPKRPETKIRLTHFTQQQKNWIKRRTYKGGKVFVLIRVEKDWFLFRYPQTHLLGNLSKKEMIESSLLYNSNKLHIDSLIKCLI